MWNSPWPPVMLVNVLAYSSISAMGTCARITWVAPFASLDWTRPRRLEMSPMMSPTRFPGAEMSTSMIGSSRVAPAFSTATTAVSHEWDFPGGTPATEFGAGPHTVTYSTAGVYDVSLTVTDSEGATGQTTVSVTVN